MDFQPKSHEQIRRLIEKGVSIPNPSTLDIGDDVSIDHISAINVKIYPGCRIYGSKTVISSGCQLGYEAPVTMEDCQLGEAVELKGGFFSKSVFLEKSSMGLGAHVREGCLIEEQAGGAHCVGLKQTILFPFVTLGSLINFCDCLMAGGTSRQNHSEVGSSYIHFNFTPDGDKATPSLIGDVPKGVMLNQPPIFLGGQGGAIGPLRMGYGNVVAAGSILRKDYPQSNQLIFDAGPAKSIRVTRGDSYTDIHNVVEHNILYLANLKALAAWYAVIRKPFFSRQEFGSLIYSGAMELLAGACKERLTRLSQMTRKALAAARPSSQAERRELITHLPKLEEWLEPNEDSDQVRQAQETFFTAFDAFKRHHTLSYLETIRELPPDTSAAGVAWLTSLVRDYCQKAAGVLPALGLFKNNQLMEE